jgi:hypothetical protein
MKNTLPCGNCQEKITVQKRGHFMNGKENSAHLKGFLISVAYRYGLAPFANNEQVILNRGLKGIVRLLGELWQSEPIISFGFEFIYLDRFCIQS